jgi:hypothetical protein
MTSSTCLNIGFEDGLLGTRYFCPSEGNPVAERDYALGWFAGETARGMLNNPDPTKPSGSDTNA